MRNRIIRVTRIAVFVLIAALIITYPAAWIAKGGMGSGRSVITITAEGIGKGLDPRGDHFDINEIKSEQVLQAAIDDMGLQESLTTAELAQVISISPQVQGNALSKLTELPETGNAAAVSEKIIYPNQFTIILEDKGLPSYVETRKLLKAVTESYQEYLEIKYTTTVSEPTFNEKNLSKVDYPEIVSLVGQQADSLIRHIDRQVKNMPTFESRNDLTFSDLLAQARFIRDTELRNMRSFVTYYALTKNPEDRKKYEEIAIERSIVKMNTELRSARGIEEMVNLYDNSTNYVMAAGGAISGISADDSGMYYGELTAQLINAKNRYIDAKYKKEEIQTVIEKLDGGQVLTTGEYSEVTKVIDQNVSDSLAMMQELREKTDELTKEYYEFNIKDKIKVSAARYYFNSWGNPIVNFLLMLVIVGVCVMLYRLMIREKSYIKGYIGRVSEKINTLKVFPD